MQIYALHMHFICIWFATFSKKLGEETELKEIKFIGKIEAVEYVYNLLSIAILMDYWKADFGSLSLNLLGLK